MEKQGQYLTPFQCKLLLKSLEADLCPEYRRIEIALLADTGHRTRPPCNDAPRCDDFVNLTPQICEALLCAQETAWYWIAIAQTGNAHNWVTKSSDKTGQPSLDSLQADNGSALFKGCPVLSRKNLGDDRRIRCPKVVNEQYRASLQELVSHSPREYNYPFQRWTAQWLGKHLAKELGIKVSSYNVPRAGPTGAKAQAPGATF